MRPRADADHATSEKLSASGSAAPLDREAVPRTGRHASNVNERREVRGIGLALAAMLVFALMDVCSKYLASRYPAPQILWLRYLLSIPLAFMLAAGTGSVRAAFRSARPGLQALRSLVIVTEMLLVLMAFAALPLADTQAILAATPLFVTALSVPLLGERVGPRRLVAVAAAFLGVLVMLRPGFGAIGWPALFALVSAVLYAFYQILTRLVGHTDGVATSFLWQFLIGAGILTLVAPFVWQPPTAAHWPLFAVIAALGAVGHFAFIRALNLAPAVVLQPFTYTLLLWEIAFGWLAFGDFPDAVTFMGGALVIAAGLYAVGRERQRTEAQEKKTI